MRVARKLEKDDFEGVSSKRNQIGRSYFTVDDDEEDNIGFKNVVADNDGVQADEKESRSTTIKTRHILGFGGLLLSLIVGVSVGGYAIAKHRSEALTTVSASTFSTFCQPSSIKDTKEPLLELTLLAGMDRLVNETEAKTLERAVMDGYNEASGGCNDDYERWIYGMFIPQTCNVYTCFLSFPSILTCIFSGIPCRIQELSLSINPWSHCTTSKRTKTETPQSPLQTNILTKSVFKLSSRAMVVQTTRHLHLNILNLLETTRKGHCTVSSSSIVVTPSHSTQDLL
jgi:hypothetical protein